jgi:hypothetical protein
MVNNNKYPRTYLRKIQSEISSLHSEVRKRFLTEAIRDSLRNMKKSYQQYETVYSNDLFSYASHNFYVNNI